MLLDLGTLAVKIRADGTDKTKKQLDGLKSGVEGIKKAAKVATAGVAAAGAAITAVTTQAVKAYGDYEQLVGGVETLFGTRGAKTIEEYAQTVGKAVDQVGAEFEMLQDAQDTVMKDAAEAYKTAGMSANNYMDTVSMLAAALNQTSASQLDSAELAKLAVTDMSDNANKMGTSIEMIKNAYQGFAKQNYTMLDNLKLGYGGTKGEMERLLADAEQLQAAHGVMAKYSVESLTDIVEAIHVVQTEMGITGTTAKEATTTIQGSLGMLKATWENLMVALADSEGNVAEAMNNVFSSVKIVAQNLKPVIEQTLSNLPELISDLGVSLMQEIPGAVNMVLPKLISSAQQLLNAFIDTLTENSDMLTSTALDVTEALISGIIECLPQIQ